jgi:hypothetical protein
MIFQLPLIGYHKVIPKSWLSKTIGYLFQQLSTEKLIDDQKGRRPTKPLVIELLFEQQIEPQISISDDGSTDQPPSVARSRSNEGEKRGAEREIEGKKSDFSLL